MGWLLSQGTAVLLWFGAMALVVASPRLRRRLARVGRAAARLVDKSHLRPAPPPKPTGRPIELIVHEARRLGARYRVTREGVSFAKAEAVRRAYDDVLAEGCDALGLPHLLAVLPPGEELDAERARVERLLHPWGISRGDAA